MTIVALFQGRHPDLLDLGQEQVAVDIGPPPRPK